MRGTSASDTDKFSPRTPDPRWRVYRRIGTVTARPYVEGEVLPPYVSVSAADAQNGSPKVGDMIARDSLTKFDEWLINERYFAIHYDTTPAGSVLAGSENPDSDDLRQISRDSQNPITDEGERT